MVCLILTVEGGLDDSSLLRFLVARRLRRSTFHLVLLWAIWIPKVCTACQSIIFRALTRRRMQQENQEYHHASFSFFQAHIPALQRKPEISTWPPSNPKPRNKEPSMNHPTSTFQPVGLYTVRNQGCLAVAAVDSTSRTAGLALRAKRLNHLLSTM